MPRRYFHRSDGNQKGLVKTLRALGLSVHVANCEYDLVVQHGGLTMLCECRPVDSAEQGPRKGRQAKFQEQFAVRWLRTNEDCVELHRVLQSWHRAIRAAG